MTSTLPSRFGAARPPQLLFTLLLALVLAAVGLAAEPVKKDFDIAAGDAARALKQFAAQSGEQLLYSPSDVAGVKTLAIKGSLTPREALTQILQGTTLIVAQDKTTGALAVRKESASETKNGLSRSAEAPAAKVAATPAGAVQLQTYEVLGSRIRRTESDGPSPVNSYGAEEIRASGAMNLADFLRTIPQTYSGVGSGRNSAPDDLNMAAGQRNENGAPAITAPGVSPLLSAAVPVQSGVSGVSLRGLGSGSTLVLVDGRRVAQAGNSNRGSATGQGFVDLNTIPLGLIERIEIITDGSSAIYGADAVAGVINIVLKKAWMGTEIRGSVKLTQHGGARERQATVTSGFAALGGRLQGTLAIDYYEREPLLASQRSFSKNPDFRGLFPGVDDFFGLPNGTDFRIQWGYPASVQAVATTGFVSIPGIRVLLAPAGFATTPPISAFERRTTNDPGQNFLFGTQVVAQGQRITNPAPYTQLIAASDRRGLTGSATYELSNGIQAYGSYSYSDSRGYAQTLPAYVANVTVSAANNIFGENIQFGMLLPQWGRLSQRTRTQTHTVTTGLRGKLGQTWSWDTGYRFQDQNYRSVSRIFNAPAFNAIANASDPTQRFNPFIDERVAGAQSQAALLEQTAIYPTLNGRSGLDSFDLSANGDLLQIWGGPIRMALGGSTERSRNTYKAVDFAGFPVVATTTNFETARTVHAAFSELQVPLFGKSNAKPLLNRFELNLAGRYEEISDQSSSSVPKYGFTWQPIRGVLLRGSYAEGFRAPSLTENRRIAATFTTTVADPLRGNTRTTVSLVNRANPNLKPETSTTEFLGAVVEPPFVKGLTLSANYYRTKQKNAIQSIGSNTILRNPTLFPGYVLRDAPTASDIALGWPGAVNTIYAQFVNFGLVQNESLDLGADYRLPWETLGRWRLTVNAAKTLKQTRQLTVGGAPVDDLGDTFASPRWNISSSLYWNYGAWGASMAYSYMSGFNTNQAGVLSSNFSSPAMHIIDLRGTYEFKQGVWRGYAKGLRVGLGVANIEDKAPPPDNNIYGFNASLYSRWAFGRTFELSFTLPLEKGILGLGVGR
jgi:outer membrane receptor protein involved in Fe transport